MADRSRRVRRQISDMTEDSSDGSQSESGEDWGQRPSGPGRSSGRFDSSASATPSNTRPKRSIATGATSTSSATIHRSTSGSPDDRRQSIRLTVKVPPSKLREVMRANEVDALQDVLGGGRVLDGPRSRRAASGRKIEKPRYAEYGESDIGDDEDDEEEDEGDRGDEEEDDEEEPLNDFDELGGEPEGGTDDEDEEMDDIVPAKPLPAPKPPKITLKAPSNAKAGPLSRPKVVVTPAQVEPLKSVEDQEMEEDDLDDEEVDSSELSEDNDELENGEEGERDEEMEDEEEDAEGEDEEMEDDGEVDSSDETTGSGMATPDLNKMTKRQRGGVGESDLLALDMAPQQRKFFTDQEKAMKKDEHARKRKELTKRKIQEEKAAALNRLLKPQASKGRGASARADMLAGTATAGSQVDDEDEYVEKANPLYTRWVSNKDGIKMGIPEEWLGKRVGKLFGPPLPPSNGMLVQELE